MNFSKIFWGFLFLVIGILLLGINFHWWDSSVWQGLLSLWPVLLILLGISIAFGESNPVGIILFVIILIGSLIYIARPIKISDDNFGRNGRDASTELATRNYSLPLPNNVKQAELNLDLGAASINLNPLNNNSLYEASFRSNTELNTSDKIEEETTKVTLDEAFQGFANFTNTSERKLDLNLNKTIPFSLKINSGASKLDLHLKELIINRLEIDAGASTQDIEIGSLSSQVKIIINAGASKVNLRLPKEYSLKILNESGLVKNNFGDLSLKKADNTYTSEDFDSNSKKIEVEVRAGASNIQVEKY